MTALVEAPAVGPGGIVWDIRPLDGVGPLRFGMTRAQVAPVLATSFP